MKKEILQTTRQSIHRVKGKARVKAGPLGTGCTIYGTKGQVEELIVPIKNDARSRTIRIHEILHANNSTGSRKNAEKYKVSQFTCDAVEDAFVHCVYWPITMLPSQANRDALCVGIQDARNLKKSLNGVDVLKTPAVFNGILYTMLRSIAIAFHTGSSSRNCRMDPTMMEVMFSRLKQMVPDPKVGKLLHVGLSSVLSYVLNNKRKDAVRIFESLLMKEDSENQFSEEKFGEEMGEESKGDKSDCLMNIEVFPLVERTSSEHMEILPMRSGSRIVASRLPTVLATHNLTGLFERERYVEGEGAILIDASGSMQPSFQELEKLCKLAPGATVAFYNGGGKRSDGTYGTLWVFAKDGMRADKLEQRSLRYAGNCVDLYALKWLLNQSAPHYFVTDQSFCGGPRGQDIAASLLLARSSEVEVIKSLSLAISQFEALRVS